MIDWLEKDVFRMRPDVERYLTLLEGLNYPDLPATLDKRVKDIILTAEQRCSEVVPRSAFGSPPWWTGNVDTTDFRYETGKIRQKAYLDIVAFEGDL